MNASLLSLELRQALKISPQMIQSTEILQMNSQELLGYLQRVSEENPLLEQGDAPDLRSSYEELRRKASWIDGGVYGAASGEDQSYDRGVSDAALSGLPAFLHDQLERMGLPKPILALSAYLVDLMDEDGYLFPDDLEELIEGKIPAAMMEQALEIVQSLEPSGVGARSLAECLTLQLKRQGRFTPLLEEIIAHHLSELGQKHYGAICRDLGLTLDEVLAAEKVIASLNPYPGREFQTEETVEYIRPDIFIAEIDGELQVILNEYYLPKISISDYYVRLLKSSEEKETLDYLRQKLQQAKWLLNYLEQRGRTLRRCADAILEAQRSFFTGATTELAPQTLVSLSRELQLHPSTVSRAIRGKYLQCRQGTYPLRYFFNRSVEENGPSRQAIKQRLMELLKGEDPSSPYSDQQLCTLLSERGTRVSRRTVAKYRLELGIASSTARKRIAR